MRQKHTLSQSNKHTSTSVESPSKSIDATPSEKLVKRSSEKTMKVSSDKLEDEEVEVSCKHMHVKFVEKGQSSCRLVKIKLVNDEEPGSSKKTKIGECSGKEKLRYQKLLWGRTFAPEIGDGWYAIVG